MDGGPGRAFGSVFIGENAYGSRGPAHANRKNALRLEIEVLSKNLKKQFVLSLAVALLAPLVAFATATPAIAQAAPEASTSAEATTEAPAKTAHKVHVVIITNRLTYQPPTLVVHVGDVVEWINKDLYIHTVTSTDGKTFDSGNIYPKRSWRYKAVRKGTYDYSCTPHPDMKGKLIVR